MTSWSRSNNGRMHRHEKRGRHAAWSPCFRRRRTVSRPPLASTRDSRSNRVFHSLRRGRTPVSSRRNCSFCQMEPKWSPIEQLRMNQATLAPNRTAMTCRRQGGLWRPNGVEDQRPASHPSITKKHLRPGILTVENIQQLMIKRSSVAEHTDCPTRFHRSGTR